MKKSNIDLVHAKEQILGQENFGGCTLGEYHQWLLKLLKEIDRICVKNDILYFLMFGSLIGAVRHKGFIPWDDDADIVMTRDNFNKFQECCKKELGEEFDLITYDNDENYNYIFPRVRLKNTTYIILSEISRHGRNAGFFIDIIIMDYVPQNRFKALVQRRALLALHRLVSPGFVQSMIGLNKVEDALVSLSKAVLGRKKSIHIAEKLIYTHNHAQSEYLLVEILLPQVNYFYMYHKYHFEQSRGLKFEDTVLQVPVDPIKLLHECYFKAYIEKHILLEDECEDEIQSINSNALLMDDIMFIPMERERNRHLEIVFDCQHSSEYYDKIYLQEINKDINDKSAVCDRRQREKIRKATAVLNRNVKITKTTCTKILLNDYMQRTMEKFSCIDEVQLEKIVEISERILELWISDFSLIDIKTLIYMFQVFIRAGRMLIAKRIGLYIEANYPQINIDLEKQEIQLQIELLRNIYEKDIDNMRKYLISNYNDFMTALIKGIILFFEGKYQEAKRELLDVINICPDCFWSHYYLGMIEMEWEKNAGKAKQFFYLALDDTRFMPELQLVLDKIREIEDEENKESKCY